MSPRFVFVGIGVRVMVFNATFNKFIRYIVGVSFIAFCSGLGLWYLTPLSTNISAISLGSVLLHFVQGYGYGV